MEQSVQRRCLCSGGSKGRLTRCDGAAVCHLGVADAGVAVLSALIHGASAVQLTHGAKHMVTVLQVRQATDSGGTMPSCSFARRPYVRRLWHRPWRPKAGRCSSSERSDRTSRSPSLSAAPQPGHAARAAPSPSIRDQNHVNRSIGASIMDPSWALLLQMLLRTPTCSLASEERAPPGIGGRARRRAGGLSHVPFLPSDHPCFEESILSRQRIDGVDGTAETASFGPAAFSESACRIGRSGRRASCNWYSDLAMRCACAKRWPVSLDSSGILGFEISTDRGGTPAGARSATHREPYGQRRPVHAGPNESSLPRERTPTSPSVTATQVSARSPPGSRTSTLKHRTVHDHLRLRGDDGEGRPSIQMRNVHVHPAFEQREARLLRRSRAQDSLQPQARVFGEFHPRAAS